MSGKNPDLKGAGVDRGASLTIEERCRNLLYAGFTRLFLQRRRRIVAATTPGSHPEANDREPHWKMEEYR